MVFTARRLDPLTDFIGLVSRQCAIRFAEDDLEHQTLHSLSQPIFISVRLEITDRFEMLTCHLPDGRGKFGSANSFVDLKIEIAINRRIR